MLDLNDRFVRAKLVSSLHKELDEFCIKEFAEEPRKHLGASILGNDCKAQSWGAFRWLKAKTETGRQYRLFNRGHLEETRFVRWLRGMGFTVWEVDQNNKQFRISYADGHAGGSADGIIWRADVNYLLVEFKTHNEKSFAKLVKDGVVKSKPVHYSQMCQYGRHLGYKFCLYMAVNKNTDEIHMEIVVLDETKADMIQIKAEAIIKSQTQPMKIAQVPTFFDCKYCHLSGICFNNEAPDKNCRSCRNAYPVENAQWKCAIYNKIIPDEVIKTGCDSYARII